MATAKKTAAKKAAPKKDALTVLREAVEAAREAGLAVRVTVTKNDKGVTTSEII